MAKKKKVFVARAMTVVSILAVVMLWVSAISPYISPETFSPMSLLGLAFPFFLIFTAFVLLLTFLLAPRRSWICLVGLLVVAGTIRNYFPVNLRSQPPRDALHVLSFNVFGWGLYPERFVEDADGTRHNVLAQYIASVDPDLAFLQEAISDTKFIHQHVLPEMRTKMYLDSVDMAFNDIDPSYNKIMMLSRFPIVRKELIVRRFANGAAAFWIVPSPGDTIIAINCHLASMGLNKNDRNGFSEMVKDSNHQIDEKTTKTLLSKILIAGKRRAAMVDSIANFIERHKEEDIILGGDFNDTPVSYAHGQLTEYLSDAFRSTGNGLGRTFNKNAMIVRIDHLFCSDAFEPYSFYVDNSVGISDHNPVVGWLEWKRDKDKK